jgi:hypothetical protein
MWNMELLVHATPFEGGTYTELMAQMYIWNVIWGTSQSASMHPYEWKGDFTVACYSAPVKWGAVPCVL